MSSQNLYTTTKRKARKSHKCSGCDDTIAKGSEYKYISTTIDGKFKRYSHCDNCDKMNELVLDNSMESYYPIDRVGYFLVQLQGYDETVCDIADLYKLPVDYASKFIN